MEIPFGFWASMGSVNHVLDWDSELLMGRGNFKGKGRPTV